MAQDVSPGWLLPVSAPNVSAYRPKAHKRSGVSTYSSDKRMLFHQEKLAWMLRFGFVSGHDFSRAVNERKEIGL